MGVPGFFKWISLRYPHIVETVKKTPRSKTDFLYLDINALFHVAIRSKVSKKPRTPRRVLSKVFKKMDTAFNVCEPQMLVYIAMDGVAPRAKMNEQRSRRYLAQENHKSTGQSDLNNTSSSESSDDNSKNGKGLGFFVPVDSAAISAGTSFMQAANDAIKYYIYQRLNGKARNLQIIFNDSSVAGEGEHKVFQFLNAQRKQPGYNPKFRHMVCGGDADFIMYALLTHEPNLRILRPGINGKDVVLNINRFRKHIVHDMVVPQLTAAINEENIIEDFVCIVNLLGNDFLPRITYLPETRVDILFQAYQNYFNESRTYITNKGGHINMEQFLKFIKFLGKGIFNHRISDLSSTSVGRINSEVAIRANDYVKTICWILQYYNGDCPNWKFYYPHHKSPSIQDILNHVHAEDFDQTFNVDTPMRPFEQLMCIIPPVCHYLLPEPFRELLTDPKSPIIDYYPRKFSCSNSKAILPFIDEKVLSQSMAPRYSLLSPEDIRRNCANGHIQIYAGRESTIYPTVYSLCMARGGKSVFPPDSVFFGELLYDGPMQKSVDSPINEWRNIYRNSVVYSEYKLPNIPKVQAKSLQLLTNITNSMLPSSFLSSRSVKPKIIPSNQNMMNNTSIYEEHLEETNANIGVLTNPPKETNAGSQLYSVQSRPAFVSLTSQTRDHGTGDVQKLLTNTLRTQALVEYLGLSESHLNDQYRRNVTLQTQVQNRTLPTEFVTDGRYFANRNQTNNQPRGQFSHYNTANYDKKYRR